MPSSVVNCTVRSLIERIGSAVEALPPTNRTGPALRTNPALDRIQCVSEAVTDEVDAEDDQDDRETRESDQPPAAEPLILALADEHAERRRRRLDPEAQERER